MNFLESIQKKYLPGFYQSRYSARKHLALSLKSKCQSNPEELSLYELKIILKVLQQFGLLAKEPLLEKKEKELRTKVMENSVYSGFASLIPWAIREFHRLRTLKKVLGVAVIFCSVDYCLMHSHFQDYIKQCRKVAQQQIGKLIEESQLAL